VALCILWCVMCAILSMFCWRGRGPRRGWNPRRGTGMGENCPPRVLTGAGTGKFYPRGDGDGRLIPDGEFPVAIPTQDPCPLHLLLTHEAKRNRLWKQISMTHRFMQASSSAYRLVWIENKVYNTVPVDQITPKIAAQLYMTSSLCTYNIVK
jgi:hypothetical protein